MVETYEAELGVQSTPRERYFLLIIPQDHEILIGAHGNIDAATDNFIGKLTAEHARATNLRVRFLPLRYSLLLGLANHEDG